MSGQDLANAREETLRKDFDTAADALVGFQAGKA